MAGLMAGPSASRLGPRPLPLHLMMAAAAWQSSRLAWPSLKLDLPTRSEAVELPGNPFASLLANPAFEALRKQAAAIDPASLGPAVERALLARASAFLEGIERYRHHPYRRALQEPPALWREGAPAGRLRAAVRAAMVAAEGDEICASRRDEVDWASVVPWLDDEGLHFEVSESDRRLLQCANDYLLSFGEARPFIAPDRLDAFYALARGDGTDTGR